MDEEKIKQHRWENQYQFVAFACSPLVSVTNCYTCARAYCRDSWKQIRACNACCVVWIWLLAGSFHSICCVYLFENSFHEDELILALNQFFVCVESNFLTHCLWHRNEVKRETDVSKNFQLVELLMRKAKLCPHSIFCFSLMIRKLGLNWVFMYLTIGWFAYAHLSNVLNRTEAKEGQEIHSVFVTQSSLHTALN